LSDTTAPHIDISLRPARVVGRFLGKRPGPTLVCTASLHGNEPAGTTALQRVFAQLNEEEPLSHGEFVGIAGNLAALARRQRFIDIDLNRCWTKERVWALRRGRLTPEERASEDAEVEEILNEAERVISEAKEEVYFLDLHTTSGESPAFGTIGDTLKNRALALQFPVPIIVGLEEHLDGTFLEYVNSLGCVTMGFEAGKHDDPVSIDRAEECIWVALAATKILQQPERVASVALARQHLSAVSSSFPRVLEVRHRHPVEPGDGFAMERGYSSFQPVKAGELLAHDCRGSLAAFEDSRVLLPLYQEQGEDGYFLMREFSPLWLALSKWLRRLGLEAALPWLPGVRRDAEDRNTLIIDRRIARWFAVQVFHLLGYRKRRMDGDVLVVGRRQE
jgi:predicted deacylase